VKNDTERDVAVADVTLPTAPLLNITELFAAVVSKPSPVMVMVDTSPPWLAVLLVTTGLTVAT